MHIVTNSEILFYFLKEEEKKASDKQPFTKTLVPIAESMQHYLPQ